MHRLVLPCRLVLCCQSAGAGMKTDVILSAEQTAEYLHLHRTQYVAFSGRVCCRVGRWVRRIRKPDFDAFLSGDRQRGGRHLAVDRKSSTT